MSLVECAENYSLLGGTKQTQNLCGGPNSILRTGAYWAIGRYLAVLGNTQVDRVLFVKILLNPPTNPFIKPTSLANLTSLIVCNSAKTRKHKSLPKHLQIYLMIYMIYMTYLVMLQVIDMTAFNTDGFDVSGKNVWIHDCQIWNQVF